MKLTNLFLMLFVLSLLFVSVAHAESGSSDDDGDHDNDDDRDDDSNSDDDSYERTMSREQAIELAQREVGDGLELVESDPEDNGWEIEFRSATREVEVFVSFSGEVTIVKDKAEDYGYGGADYNNFDSDEVYPTGNNPVRNIVPKVTILEAIDKAQVNLQGRIIEVKLKNRGDSLYWEIESHLKEKLELSAGDGSVREIRTEAVKEDESTIEVRAKIDDNSIEIKAEKDTEARQELEAKRGKQDTSGQGPLQPVDEQDSEQSFWTRLASIFS